MNWRDTYQKIAHPPWEAKRVDRWKKKTPGGYVFDRRIFLLSAGLILLFLCYAAYDEFGLFTKDFTMQKTYLNCPIGGGLCQNPLYETCDEWYCEQEVLPEGFTYGEKPGSAFNAVIPVSLLLLLLAFIVNHFVYNKHYEFEVER